MAANTSQLYKNYD